MKISDSSGEIHGADLCAKRVQSYCVVRMAAPGEGNWLFDDVRLGGNCGVLVRFVVRKRIEGAEVVVEGRCCRLP